MAKSAAKKKREKMQREGKHNPAKDRGLYAFAERYRRLAGKTAKTKKNLSISGTVPFLCEKRAPKQAPF